MTESAEKSAAQLGPFLRRLGRVLHANRDWVALALLLLLFWLYKLRDLALPYFWDELGVYGRAAVYLRDHTLGLLPAHLPPELSRGHPLLLPFAFAALFRVFGTTPLVAHVFMLLLATGLLVSVFWIARSHWNAPVALAAAALLLVQPLFLAQSTLLLPELPLALACLWAMHAFARHRYLRAGVCLTLAISLKETALVLGVVLGVMLLVEWLALLIQIRTEPARREGLDRNERRGRILDVFNRGVRQRARSAAATATGEFESVVPAARPSLKSALAGVLALLVPALLYGLFLLIQKRQNGWYFFPLHEHHVNFHWPAMKGKLADYITFVFVEQGRFALSVIVALWLLFRLFGRRAGGRRFVRSLAWTFALFGIGILVFSAGNFFMKRYLLCLLPPLAIVGSRALFELVRDQTRVLVPALAGLCLLSLGELTSPGFNYDYDMSFRQSVLLQLEATRYLEDTVGTDKPILTIFPPIFGLEDPRYGYARKKFKRYSHIYFPEAEYIFVSEALNRYAPPAGVRTELIKRFSCPTMSIFLYRIRH